MKQRIWRMANGGWQDRLGNHPDAAALSDQKPYAICDMLAVGRC